MIEKTSAEFHDTAKTENLTVSSRPKFAPSEQTRTAETETFYNYRATLILRKIADHLPPETPIGPTEIHNWLKSNINTVRQNTGRLYKAVLVHHITKNMECGVYSESESVPVIAKIKTLPTNPVQPKEHRSSSNSAKQVNEKLVEKLLVKLDAKAGYATHCAALMFQSTIIAGLRPVEWTTARVEFSDETSGITLVVKNAKNTNGRANSDYRKIEIRPGKESDIVRQTIEYIRSLTETGLSQTTILNAVRQAVRLANIRTSKGKKVTMYSARHQFSANIKNTKTREEVAKMMGHASINTAANHYGKGRYGHKAFRGSGGDNLTNERDQHSKTQDDSPNDRNSAV